ncbi:MAG: GTP 3',8-cyclase MoaA [Mariprofundales bacterium]|nr:GTP 3',8-cyclase MoaA [Mariprofundales bacterium]
MPSSPLTFYPSPPHAENLTDSFGRQLTYLRISVTDRCNLHCSYCRPASENYQAEARSHILTFDEITRIVRVAAGLGVRKVRITGGEPLVRRNLTTLIAKIAAISGIDDLAMTSNASLLAQAAQPLADAGLHRINISLDTLNPARFRALTGGDLAPVLDGIAAAQQAGLSPIKLNTVLMRGVNVGGEESEVARLIDFAQLHDLTIRFIELMPMKQGLDWKRHYVAIDEVLARNDLQARVAVDAPLVTGNTAARYLPHKQGTGKVGFIMPMSEHFCSGCNRLRLTADGHLRSCLPANTELNLRDMMRQGADDAGIRALLLRAAMTKPEIGIYSFTQGKDQRSMIQIGG